jgi:hypothetical protein
MVTAEKMSVQQLQESIQNGVLPAYIGIPILKNKMQSQQAPQEQQPQKPPIAQEIMQQASGLDGLPSNLPTSSAPEGVVALAEGGYLDEFLTDDPYEEAVADDEYSSALNSLYSSMGDMNSMSYPDKTMMPTMNTTPDVEKPMRQAPKQQNAPTDGISGLLQSSADKYNVPPELLSSIAQAESGGRADAQNPRSSAGGVFQFIDDTWSQLGGTKGGKNNPEENIDLGAKYTRQNSEYLKSQLGRDPSYAEVYAAHHFGPGVVKMLQNADPREPIESGLSRFNSPQSVDRILQQNPYLQGKTVGDLLASLETKAGEGIVSLASGGQVARYPDGGYISDNNNYTDFGSEQYVEPVAGPFGDMSEYGFNTYGGENTYPESGVERHSLREMLIPEPVTGPFGDMSDYGINPYGKENTYPESGVERRSLREMLIPETMKQSPLYIQEPKKVEPVATADITKPAPVTTPTATTTKTKNIQAPALEDKKVEDLSKQMLIDQKKNPEKSFSTIFQERMAKADTDAEKQRTMDAYMALTTAGFAMMGGSSSNAFENISQGALAGIAQYGGSQKARAAEGLARDKNLLTAERNQQLSEAAKLTAGLNEQRLTEAEKTRAATRVQNMVKSYIESTPALLTNPDKINVATAQLMSNPAFKQDYELIYGKASNVQQNPYAGYSAKPISK